MADGYARAKRGVGVCMSTVGPGAVNLVSGIAASFKAQIPVLAITGIHDQKILEKDSFHEMDQVGLFRPITKWSACIHQPEKVPEMMRKAFRVALTGRRGPVHLAIPSDVSRGILNFETSAPARYRPSREPGCAPEAVDEIFDLLKQSKSPVILAGWDVLWSEGREYLDELAEALQIPVATMLSSLGAFPYSHPLGVGIIGRGRGEAGNAVVQQADLILALGVKFDYQSTRYNNQIIPSTAKIVHISTDAEEIGRPLQGAPRTVDRTLQLEGPAVLASRRRSLPRRRQPWRLRLRRSPIGWQGCARPRSWLPKQMPLKQRLLRPWLRLISWLRRV